ncbi:hypothetical protein RHGRI_018584 [Rhododendron griersonianum]|uniref:Uncharacterized protein n=1 Tax=Rhododendron griersonianum TaxID=479676 RepID=A0AAV6K281_9ERIC|nr:hypothetical protein RHGRI_018584 [Rhododendron griersonianum]
MAVGGNPPRRRSVQPRFPKEEEVSNDVSITKLLAGNHQPRGRTGANDTIGEWPFTSKSIPDPVVDCSKLPIFDEEPFIGGEHYFFTSKEDNVFTDGCIVEVAEEQTLGFQLDNNAKNQGIAAVVVSTGARCMEGVDGIKCKVIGDAIGTKFTFSDPHPTRSTFFTTLKSYDWVYMNQIFFEKLVENFVHNIPKLDEIEADRSNHFWEFIEHAGSKGPWISFLKQRTIPLITEDFSFKVKFEKINLKFKIDADKVRRNQLHKLEDEFLQDGENDAEWKWFII